MIEVLRSDGGRARRVVADGDEHRPERRRVGSSRRSDSASPGMFARGDHVTRCEDLSAGQRVDRDSGPREQLRRDGVG